MCLSGWHIIIVNRIRVLLVMKKGLDTLWAICCFWHRILMLLHPNITMHSPQRRKETFGNGVATLDKSLDLETESPGFRFASITS